MSASLPVGDPDRARLGRAVAGAGSLTVVFWAFTWLTKEVPALYVRVPWQDDPYDAVVSTALWCLPLLTAVLVARVPLCRRAEPLPTGRALDLARAGRAVVAAVLVTQIGDWVAFVRGDHRGDRSPVTWVALVLLAVLTVCAVALAARLRALRRRLEARGAEPGQPDWMTDLVALATLVARPWHADGLVAWADREVVARVRAHPLAVAAAASLGLGVAVMGPQSVVERYPPGLALLVVGVTACTAYAVIVAVGAHLRVLGPLPPVVAPATVAVVVAAAAVPLAASFRGGLLWLVGSDDARAGVAQLAELCALAALLAAAGGWTVQRARLRPSRGSRRRT